MTPDGRRDFAIGFGLASVVFGATFGVVATAEGIPWPLVMLTSLLVFGGGAQFSALGVLQAGGSATVAVAVGLALNARFLLMGLPVAARLSAGFRQRTALALLSIDGSLVAALAEPDPEHAQRAFLRMGLLIFGLWQIGTLVGIVAGERIADPSRFGVDALIPAVFLGLLAPMLSRRSTRLAALTGAGVAFASLPVSPAGVPVAAGTAAGVLAGLLAARSR